jgi:glycosyltransferase involved in cell wall biosynthesis
MNNNYKVCIIGGVHWSAAMGGIEYQVKLLIDKLKKNTDIYFITHSIAKEYVPDGYKIIRLRANKRLIKYASFFGITQLYNLLRMIRPHVIYQNGASSLISAAAFYSHRFNCTLIWHVASDNDVLSIRRISPIRHMHKLLDKKFLQYGIKRAHKIIVQTNFQAQLVQKLNSQANIFLIKNFHPIPEEVSETIKKNQIIWVANLKRLKQPEVFIDLSRALFEKRIDVDCIMIGAPTSYPPMYQQLLEHMINKIPNLCWLGKQPIDIVNRYMAESKIFINTSKWEGFPNTYIQAWMRETPVVTLNCDPDNLIHHLKLGLRSETYDRLVNDVITLLHNDKARICMGKNARQFAIANHSLKNLDQLIKIITCKSQLLPGQFALSERQD